MQCLRSSYIKRILARMTFSLMIFKHYDLYNFKYSGLLRQLCRLRHEKKRIVWNEAIMKTSKINGKYNFKLY